MSRTENQALQKKKRSTAKAQFVTSRFLAKTLALGKPDNGWKNYSAMYLPAENTFAVTGLENVRARYSISHSESLVVLSDVAQYQAAIDTQFHNKTTDRWQSILQAFHPSEQISVKTSDQFYKSWVAKEAVAKLLGVSYLEILPIALATLEQSYRIDYFNIGSGVSCALARAPEDERPIDLCHWKIDYPDIVKVN